MSKIGEDTQPPVPYVIEQEKNKRAVPQQNYVFSQPESTLPLSFSLCSVLPSETRESILEEENTINFFFLNINFAHTKLS